MDKLFESSLKIIEHMFGIFEVIGTFLIKNTIFQVLIGIIILFLLIGIIFYIINNSKPISYDIGNAKASYMDGNKHVAEYKTIRNGQVVYYKKIWNKKGKLIYDGSK